MVKRLIQRIKKKKNLGFTLVEVMVAAAILSLVVTPILSSFVAIARINAKSRRRLSATTIANSVMESVKGFELSEISRQCNSFSATGFHIVAGTVGGASEVIPSGDSASHNGTAFVARESGEYEFLITGVQMDGTTYDVRLKYKKNDSKTNAALTGLTYIDANNDEQTKTTTMVLGEMGVRVLTFYDVEVNVYRGGASSTSAPLATITGSKADYTTAPPTTE